MSRKGPSSALTISAALKSLRKPELKSPLRFWAGDDGAPLPSRVAEMREQLAEWMRDRARVEACVGRLSAGERAVLRAFVDAPRHTRRLDELRAAVNGSTEESVEGLKRSGLLYDDDEPGAWVLPVELAQRLPVDALERGATESRGGGDPGETFRTVTLKGHLEKVYSGPEVARPMPAARLKEMYKMYSNEAQSVARVERLPEGLRALVGRAVLEFGGMLPRRFFDRLDTELPHWNQRRWAKIMGESLVGTVERLDFTPYGIQHDDDTLIVFNEVTLAWFKRVAVPSDPDAPHDDCSLGVDLLANVSRFFAYLHDHAVRFTVKGEIFKTTEKRILTELIPNPGRELERAEVLQFIFQFACSRGLIDVTGQRTFKLRPEARDFDAQGLDDKLDALFDFIMSDMDPATESIHQPTLRAVLVRMIKKLEIGVWYDLMYLPFLARNAYVARLEETFPEGTAGDATGAPEDLQRMAWNLVSWVRRRLYLLGLVDLGYDAGGHPVAMRLTRIGARAFGMIERETDGAPEGIGRLITTPDFDVMLMESGDDADLTHDLDRFADRVKDGASVARFKLSERSVHRGLVEGMTLQRMSEVLTLNARTPVPRNVLQSMRGWAQSGGLMTLGEDHVVRSRDPLLLARFARDAGVRPFIKGRVDGDAVRLKPGTSRARYRTLLRDLGYLIELDGDI